MTKRRHTVCIYNAKDDDFIPFERRKMRNMLPWIVLLLAASNNIYAQTCPAVLVGSTQLKQVPTGWAVEHGEERYALAGLTVYAGEAAPNTGDLTALAEQAPVVEKGVQTWHFDTAVGKDEFWMKCWYSGTSLSVRTRIDPNVNICVRKDEKLAIGARTASVVASCDSKAGSKKQ